MSNKITEKYFTQDDFSKREKEVLEKVIKETGFVIEKEIFRGLIYDKKKVGSLIYLGVFKEKPAVLKLQGLEPEIDESGIIKHFKTQNRSKIVRTPELYAYKLWNAKRGYGYLITEYIDAPTIFEMPFASSKQMKDFARFYQEYRTSSLTRSWIEPEILDSLVYTFKRVDHWRKISESKRRLKLEEYAPYLSRYYPLVTEHLQTIPMIFCHGHLTANDIFKLPDSSFVVLSNLFWSYRPEWYDLAFNIWACLQHIRDTEYSFDEMLKYVEKWLAVYKKIPVVKKDQGFDRKITVLLLERTIGAILVDLGANEFYDNKNNRKYFYHLLDLHQKLFNHLAEKLETQKPK